MALKIDITDEKGVKTRYHKITRVEFDSTSVYVTLIGFVNATLRDAEKANQDIAESYQAYQDELDTLKDQVSTTPEGVEKDELRTKLADKLASAPARPELVKLNYNERSVTLPYFEPLSISSVYGKLAETGEYAGAENI